MSVTSEIDPIELSDALTDLNAVEQAIAEVFLEMMCADRRKGEDVAAFFMPRVLAAQRAHEASLLQIHDELTQIRNEVF